MRTCRTRTGRVATVAVAAATAIAAHAQPAASVAVDSDYRVRGVSLSDARPTLRVALDVDGRGGWYAGVLAARVEPARGDRYTLLQPYAGRVVRLDAWRRIEFGADFSHFDGGADYDYAEAYVGLLAERWSARLHVAPDYFGRRVRTAYVELNGHALLGARARVFGHAGVLVPSGGRWPGANRTRADLRVGAGLALGDLDLQLAWVAATRGGPYPAVDRGRRSAWVATASIAF